jgi:fucose 4-O-acetylase-like acetyltransferase
MTRDPVFDIAKGLGVVLVMLGHLNLQFWAINAIYFFHMPLFVLIAGFFHKQKAIKDILKSIGRLLISYYLYGAAFIIISLAITGDFNKTGLYSYLEARPIGIWEIPYFGVFWFIIVITVIKVLAYWVPLNKTTLWVSCLIFVGIYYLNREVIDIRDLPLALGQVLILFPFYVFGYLLKTCYGKVSKFSYLILPFYSILTFLSIFFVSGASSKIVNYHHLFLFNPLIAIVLAISGALSLILISGWLKKYLKRLSVLVEAIGRYSFFYFATHMFCFAVISYGLLFLDINNMALRNTLMLFLTLILCRAMLFLLIKVGKKFPSVSAVLLLK